jgi:transposase
MLSDTSTWLVMCHPALSRSRTAWAPSATLREISNVCSVVGLDGAGKVVMRRKMMREALAGLAAKLPPFVVAMEASYGAHHVGRVFAAHDRDVRLMSPEYVRPYIKAQKNDDRDAEGIAEAATRGRRCGSLD